MCLCIGRGFVVGLYTITSRAEEYASPLWNVAEYLALFMIVLLHEFGHSLACRQTGGQANLIVLWPLGGVAYVAPPQRPGAQLWSLAAGPLVNLMLAPLLYGALWLAASNGLADTHPDFVDWLSMVNWINAVLFIFNMLPVYPLDGGQILRSLLWFWCGPATSLLVATSIGFIGGAGLVAYGIFVGSIFTVVMAGFLLFTCWKSFRFALALRAHLRGANEGGVG